jgi:uncharacterized protein (DUF2336 family)
MRQQIYLPFTMPATFVGNQSSHARELIIFEGVLGFVHHELVGMGASQMHDGMNEFGNQAEAGTQRRPVNAESFRRLTALLKAPVAAATIIPPLPDFAAPPLVGADVQAFQIATEHIAEELPQEAAIAENAQQTAEDGAEFLAPSVETTAPAVEAVSESAVAALDAAEEMPAQLEYVPQEAVARAFAETPLLGTAPPNVEFQVETAPEVQELNAAHSEHEEFADSEPEQAEAPVAIVPEPEFETVAEVEAKPAVPATDEIQPAPVILAAVKTESATARRLRQKAADDFSNILPPALQNQPAPQIKQTPQQEAESAELAQSLMDMMAASASGGQPQERALAADTLLRLLPRLPARTRTTLAERLAMMDAPPPFLVAKLLADNDLSICGPLLEDCMHISDEDLLQLIDSRNPDKRRLIARRRRISRPVSEALAATGDTSALLTLVRNQGAEIAQEGFALLSEAAMNNAELLPPLCTRQDLPVHLAFELFWFAPAQLRRYLLSRFLTDSENLTKILKITMDSHGEDQAPSPGIDVEAVGHAFLIFMSDGATVAERDEQISILAGAAKVKPATVERIFEDDQGEPLMALLKVLGVPRSMLEAEMHQFTSSAHRLIDPSRNLSEVQAVFDQLSFTKARILLTYWDWATTKSGPYAAAN